MLRQIHFKQGVGGEVPIYWESNGRFWELYDNNFN
jgi:hypothetical protein